ncbi:hypothetical protein CANCADRAFT_44837 [Tortispora caseinolytica NRRL Y-17796]|uniref:Ran-binding-domain-containing protein n=1 Tax=Tortispora caseinolytica NRRL Y-17796 TaxID=767744 RepID=A0A1E4THL4_9ASCO|nr:hypothetical protein CANCADRAFT_44837 [Tortispora caseinolytica NRRL Y-17796]
MDDFLTKARTQAVSFAIKSGFSLASAYAIKAIGQYTEKLPESETRSLRFLKEKLRIKINIVVPATDLIQLVAARGNSSIDSAVELANDLRSEIDQFHMYVDRSLDDSMLSKFSQSNIAEIENRMKLLIAKLDDVIPLLTLALTISGATLNASLPKTISPSRLLQAAKYIGDTNTRAFEALKPAENSSPDVYINVGPEFILKLYTVSTTNVASKTWKYCWREEFAKCRVQLRRAVRLSNASKSDFYTYELKLCEDLNDGLYHEESEIANTSNGFPEGLTKTLSVSGISKLFFSASGKLLEVDDCTSPVLILKLNKHFQTTSDTSKFEVSKLNDPTSIDWFAFELWKNYADADTDDENTERDEENQCALIENGLTESFKGMSLNSDNLTTLRPSLSLLECLLRLAALQQNDQESMYSITDERISLYLHDEDDTLATSTRPDYEQHIPAGLLHRFNTSVEQHGPYIAPTESSPERPKTSRSNVFTTPSTNHKPFLKHMELSSKPISNDSGIDFSDMSPWEKDRLRSMAMDANESPLKATIKFE